LRVVTIEAADVRQSRFLEEYGRQHAPAKGKRHTPVSWRVTEERGGVAGVTLEEVINRARALYPDLKLSQAAARTWVARDLLPEPDIEYLGQGKGTRAHYSDGSPAQMAAAAFTASRGYTQKQVAQARRVVLEGVPVADDLMSDVVRILTNNISPDFIPSKGALELAGAIQRYSLALAMARGGRVVSKPWGHLVGIAHGTDTAGRPTFAYYASIPGLYWDPRIEGKQPDIALDLDQQIRAQRAALAALRDRNGAS